MKRLSSEIRRCDVCSENLPLGPRPALSAALNSRIPIIGQAPGTKVHPSGVPWDDPSGKRLPEWLGVDDETFYDENVFGIVPMGFCYPGKGKSGDLPPRPECAPLWHDRLLAKMKQVELTLLIGAYAQQYYLKDAPKLTLTERVQNFEDYLPLPHPSPRNRYWLKKNPWFEEILVPFLKNRVQSVLTG